MIPHNLPTLGAEEQGAAIRVLQRNWVAQGPEVEAFENELCRFLNIPDGHAVAVSSGSAALYLALWALEGKKKRIGLPVYSCAALRNAVGLVDGIPVYLDCGEESPNINTDDAGKAGIDILIAPSMFGIPVCMPETMNVKVIEDIAQSLGAMVSGERIGLRGEVGICSFYATKLITTGGQGGAVISKNKVLIDKIKDYREFDCRDDSKLRFNFQMTDMQAAIGRVQLKRLPEFLEKREQLFEIYSSAGIELLEPSTPSHIPVRYRAVVRCSEPMVLIKRLSENGIRAIIPLERWELLDNPHDYSNAEMFSWTSISLPVYPELSPLDAKNIGTIIKESL
ncbi:MAG: DegT/DnrJ/EryC1/StrS aminotransferase family protein [Chlorobium sp.]|nr:MAG: DegT/DnrJ/EryC1/StrS aminotransferase family protein [Chlorobium sp.]